MEKIVKETPYKFRISNISNENMLSACLFGYSENLTKVNRGSDIGIKIDVIDSELSYIELLSKYGTKPFQIEKIRIKSSNKEQLYKCILKVKETDANENSVTIPLTVGHYVDDINENEFVDIPYIFNINGFADICLNVLPSADLDIYFYVNEKSEFEHIQVSTIEFENPLNISSKSKFINDFKNSNFPYFYSYDFENKTNQILDCVVFGSYYNMLSVNFGSDLGINIHPKQNNVSYLQCLKQSENQPFFCDKIKIQSLNTEQLHQKIYYHKDIDLEGILINEKDINEIHNLNVPLSNEINGYSFLKFKVLPNTKGSIYIYQQKQKLNENI